MTSRNLGQVQLEVRNNDPEIKPMQVWTIEKEDGEILRSFLLLALDPFEASKGNRCWIYRDMGGSMRTDRVGEYSICPEFNLRYIARIHQEVYDGKTRNFAN